MQNLLHINASARYQDSVTRTISAQLVTMLARDTKRPVIQRDLAEGVPFIDADWVRANFTDADQRSASDRQALALSDSLVAELQQARDIVIAAPIYNFGIPAVLKAWIDQVARAKLTFRYTDNGPEGLLGGRRAYLVIASGGVPAGSEADHATPYLQQALRFLGIEDIRLVDANPLSQASANGEDFTGALQPLLAELG